MRLERLAGARSVALWVPFPTPHPLSRNMDATAQDWMGHRFQRVISLNAEQRFFASCALDVTAGKSMGKNHCSEPLTKV